MDTEFDEEELDWMMGNAPCDVCGCLGNNSCGNKTVKDCSLNESLVCPCCEEKLHNKAVESDRATQGASVKGASLVTSRSPWTVGK